METIIAALIIAAALILIGFRKLAPAQTVFDYQRGLLYRNGTFKKLLAPGRYRPLVWGTNIVVEDLREKQFVVPGQELLTSDRLTVKISLVVSYKTIDPRRAHEVALNFVETIYNAVQIALREVVGGRTLDEVLSGRAMLPPDIVDKAKDKYAEVGLELSGVNIKDVMLSSETKRAFSDIFRAQKEGEAALERARGETAALRSLANAARMLKENPGLYQLRLLQAISDPNRASATVVVNASGESVLPINAS